ncbi:hypothetical protein LN449_15420 [Xanthomonas cannabis]|nr:hypothetical protein [Xanthomonas cannabis]MCC8443898.1 hypothetical protein [Xanthomonas cannabis]
MSEQKSFCVAAFSVDGLLVGAHQWTMASLSPNWLDLCSEYLDHHGDHFNAQWSGALAHISTNFTSEQGVALVTFSSNGMPAASILLASGKSRDADLSAMKLFINSLIGIDAVRLGAATDEPFREMLSIPDRPLMVVVPWADESDDAQEHSLIRELSLHLAAAYFLLTK